LFFERTAELGTGNEAFLEEQQVDAVAQARGLPDLFVHVEYEKRTCVFVGRVGDDGGEVAREPPRIEVVLGGKCSKLLAIERALGHASQERVLQNGVGQDGGFEQLEERARAVSDGNNGFSHGQLLLD
jgi:hypothetical protein